MPKLQVISKLNSVKPACERLQVHVLLVFFFLSLLTNRCDGRDLVALSEILNFFGSHLRFSPFEGLSSINSAVPARYLQGGATFRGILEHGVLRTYQKKKKVLRSVGKKCLKKKSSFEKQRSHVTKVLTFGFPQHPCRLVSFVVFFPRNLSTGVAP